MSNTGWTSSHSPFMFCVQESAESHNYQLSYKRLTALKLHGRLSIQCTLTTLFNCPLSCHHLLFISCENVSKVNMGCLRDKRTNMFHLLLAAETTVEDTNTRLWLLISLTSGDKNTRRWINNQALRRCV